MKVYKSKVNWKNIAASIINVLKPIFNTFTFLVGFGGGLTRIFSTSFKNNKLKNETRELAKNMITGYNFWSHHQFFNFSNVETSYRHFKSYLKQQWFANGIFTNK